MLFKTHAAIGIFLILFFLPLINQDIKLLFAGIVLFSSFLPDIDMSKSFLGKYKILRPIQWIVSHRGIFHSFSFAGIVAILLGFYIPSISFAFFLGYSGHLIADSLTVEGIRPFWPKKEEIRWKLRTGGKREIVIFYTLMIVNVFLFVRFLI